ncbi:MAG TPA: lanthionine synthetase LanC family protein, partial [Candidatus Hodarchaeales archaeon]|nr:lanthionine synthetase LanC family protein [Candidatus Hodarchaeales archaeon]
MVNDQADGWLQQAEEAGNLLIAYARKNADGWSWKKILNFDDDAAKAGDSQFYPGYYHGASGIADQFLELYKTTKNSSYLFAAERAADYVISQQTSDEGHNVWYRAEDSNTAYLGQKYGYAGIATFLANLYNASGNETYLDLLELSLNELLSFAMRDNKTGGLHWGYNIWTLDSYTDFTYGSAGIAAAFLRAYEITGNTSYLRTIEEAVSWILGQGTKAGSGDTEELQIYASPSPSYRYGFAGYSNGGAGIGSFFLQLYNTTKNQTYLATAKALGRGLITSMKEGDWTYGGVDYVTDLRNELGGYYGYAAGSSGIGIFFLDLFRASGESGFLYPVNIILTRLANTVIKNDNNVSWRVMKAGYYENQTRTGIDFGVAGIGLFYAKIRQFFGDYGNADTYLFGIDGFLNESRNSSGLIP